MDNLEEKMLIDAISAGLTDLISDIRSEETESTLSLDPQARDIKRMVDKLRNRLYFHQPQPA